MHRCLWAHVQHVLNIKVIKGFVSSWIWLSTKQASVFVLGESWCLELLSSINRVDASWLVVAIREVQDRINTLFILRAGENNHVGLHKVI